VFDIPNRELRVELSDEEIAERVAAYKQPEPLYTSGRACEVRAPCRLGGAGRRHLVSKLLYEKRDRIAYLTLNRPEAKNAIDPELHQLLQDAWADFAADEDLDVAILTGSGDAFSAGADLKTYIPPLMDGRMSGNWVRENARVGLGGLTRGQHRIYKPVIAAGQRMGARWRTRGPLSALVTSASRLRAARCSARSRRRRGYHHGDRAASCAW